MTDILGKTSCEEGKHFVPRRKSCTDQQRVPLVKRRERRGRRGRDESRPKTKTKGELPSGDK